MSTLQTTWGYTLSNAAALSDLITLAEFNTLTANKYAGDTRIAGNISAASEAIQNYCGWHVYPSQSCEYSEYLLSGNGRIKRSGRDLLIQLPATYVTAIDSVKIDGDAWTDFALSKNGLLRLFDVNLQEITRKTEIVVEYTAGLPDALMSAIKELVAHRVTHALVSSAGVQSESAGGVSVTYSASWINTSRSTALAADNKEVLDQYKLREVF